MTKIIICISLIILGIRLCSIDGEPFWLIITAIGCIWMYFMYRKKNSEKASGSSSSISDPVPSESRATDPVPNKIETKPVASTVSVAAAETVAKVPAKPSGKCCPHCGAKVEEDDIYCVECGNKVQ